MLSTGLWHLTLLPCLQMYYFKCSRENSLQPLVPWYATICVPQPGPDLTSLLGKLERSRVCALQVLGKVFQHYHEPFLQDTAFPAPSGCAARGQKLWQPKAGEHLWLCAVPQPAAEVSCVLVTNWLEHGWSTAYCVSIWREGKQAAQSRRRDRHQALNPFPESTSFNPALSHLCNPLQTLLPSRLGIQIWNISEQQPLIPFPPKNTVHLLLSASANQGNKQGQAEVMFMPIREQFIRQARGILSLSQPDLTNPFTACMQNKQKFYNCILI